MQDTMSVVMRLLVCMLLFVAKDGNLIYSFQPQLDSAIRPPCAMTRKYSSGVDDKSRSLENDRLQSISSKVDGSDMMIEDSPKVMVRTSSTPSSIPSSVSTKIPPPPPPPPPSSSSSSSSSSSVSYEETNYSHGTEEIHRYIFPLTIGGSDVSANTGSSLLSIMQGVDNEEGVEMTYSSHHGGGVFVNYRFPTASAQHDIRIGKLPPTSKLMCTSRIKRWWMAPFFAKDVDHVPIETQLLLVEIDPAKTAVLISELLSLRRNERTYKNEQKVYAVLIPLIDYNKGFRMTLFGGNEGGYPAGNEILASRAESGDPQVLTNKVDDALFIATGSDPYKLLKYAYSTVSERMKTFRTRDKKPATGNDGFGYCTWDAFYSSVTSEKVETALESLRKIGAPPKYVIIDDGWQSVANMGENREETLGDDGELSGAQIDGGLAAEKIIQSRSKSTKNPFSKLCNWVLALATKIVTSFYTDVVEKAPPDDWSVKLWTFISRTLIKNALIDFFAKQTDFAKRLTSWKANRKFEDPITGKTLKSFVRKLKNEKGIEKVYVWHALSGYWGGISDDKKDDFFAAFSNNSDVSDRERDKNDGEFEKMLEGNLRELERISGDKKMVVPSFVSVKEVYSKPTPHLLMIEPALAWDPSSLSGCGTVEIERLPTMYRLMHSYLAEAGIDGVKVDAQSGIGTFGSGFGGGAALTRAAVRAVELSVKKSFGQKFFPLIERRIKGQGSKLLNKVPGSRLQKILPLWLTAPRPVPIDPVESSQDSVPIVGCMCHSTENLLAYYETASARASDDFYPLDISAQTVHLVSCAYNSVMLGEIATPDWDMFHSQHEYADMHAASRAISGGPVYVSDSPGRHNIDILKRLVLPSGKVLKCSQPARPTADSLFMNVMEDGVSAMKIFSRNAHGGGVVGVFNTQGSRWSRKERKYVTDLIKPPFVIGQVMPKDCGVDYVEESVDLMKAVSYAAWSSNTKMLTILDSHDSTIETYLPRKGWEIFTIHAVMEIEVTGRENIAEPSKENLDATLRVRLRDQVEDMRNEIERLRAENEMYKKELLSMRENIENQMGLSFSSNFEAALLEERLNGDSNDDGNKKIRGRKLKVLNNFRRTLIPVAATMGWAFAKGQGLGVAAKIGAAVAGGVAGLVAKKVPAIQSDVGGMTIRWAPIGLLDMYNPGGAITFVEPLVENKQSGKANSIFYAQGEGRFGVYCSRRPSEVMVDDQQVSTTYDMQNGLLEFQLTETERFSEKVLDELERLVVLDERKVSFKW